MSKGAWSLTAGPSYCDGLFYLPEGGTVGGAHQEEGAHGCLFLMVASEHSASEVSQSESPKCSGFCV